MNQSLSAQTIQQVLWLIPCLPLAGAVVNGLAFDPSGDKAYLLMKDSTLAVAVNQRTGRLTDGGRRRR